MKKNTKLLLLLGIIALIIIAIVFYFKINVYKVNFYSEGELLFTETVRKNEPVKEPTSPKKDGYMFIGWYENNELFNFDNKIDHDTNLVAGWGKITTDE